MCARHLAVSKITIMIEIILLIINLIHAISNVHGGTSFLTDLLLFLNGEKSPLKNSQLINELTLYFYKLCHFWLWWSTNIMISISESHKHSSWCSERHHVQVILKQLHIKRSVDNGKANGRCCGIIITNYSPNALHSTVR